MSLFGDSGAPEKIDAAVRSRLAHSLGHIVSRAGSYLDLNMADIENAQCQIRNNKQYPGIFARYYDMIFAINSNQFVVANQLFTEIIELSNLPVEFTISSYSKKTLKSDYERFPRLLFSEYEEANPMASPSKDVFTTYARMTQEGMRIVRQIDKSIYDEMTGLLSRIYIATGSNNTSASNFAGVTSFMVWGASFINVDFYKTQWQVVQFLVHEITHSLLYGISYDNPLIMNHPADNYKSPLRTDGRPMDGIYHATLVCARLAEFNRMWLESGLLDKDARDRIEQTMAQNLMCFQDGAETITKHGKLSVQAQQLLERSYASLSVSF